MINLMDDPKLNWLNGGALAMLENLLEITNGEASEEQLDDFDAHMESVGERFSNAQPNDFSVSTFQDAFLILGYLVFGSVVKLRLQETNVGEPERCGEKADPPSAAPLG